MNHGGAFLFNYKVYFHKITLPFTVPGSTAVARKWTLFRGWSLPNIGFARNLLQQFCPPRCWGQLQHLSSRLRIWNKMFAPSKATMINLSKSLKTNTQPIVEPISAPCVIMQTNQSEIDMINSLLLWLQMYQSRCGAYCVTQRERERERWICNEPLLDTHAILPSAPGPGPERPQTTIWAPDMALFRSVRPSVRCCVYSIDMPPCIQTNRTPLPAYR